MSTLQKQLVAKRGLLPISEDQSTTATNASTSSLGSHVLRKNKTDIGLIQWDTFFDRKEFVSNGKDLFCVYIKGNDGLVFYLLHGGGYSGLTWACLTEILSKEIECRIVAPDLRGHGETQCENEDDLSVEKQVEDIITIHSKLFQDEEVPTVLVGHSMGGALAVHVAASNRLKTTVALCVIDVVEGSAMEALSRMRPFLNSRPQRFDTVEDAIQWCLRTKTAKNVRAARISMPSQIQEVNGHYRWRIDLTKTEDHWIGWFKGLSKLFLNCPVPKVLVLAGADRLDTELTVGQMQGKFQNTILPRVGHAVQEDSPEKLSDVLAKFVIRFKLCTPK